MNPTSVDRDFACFCAARDPRSLGRVFDATAPELLRLAHHLSGGDREAAEDLVQQTFLTALERPGLHDGERPVLPWLCGILANRARMEQRRRRLDRRRQAPLPDLAHPARGPLDHAIAGETDQALAERLQGLTEPYRSVLVLYLQHGLSPAEIGDALGRPGGTVRSQLLRGLEQLRRTLPALALGAVALPDWNSTALAGLRAKLIAAAGLHPIPITGLAGLGASIMAKKALLGVAVTAAILTVVASFSWLGAGHQKPPRTETSPGVPRIAAPEHGTESAPIVTSPPAPRTRATVEDRPGTHVVVHVVRSDGSPVRAPAVVHLRPTDSKNLLATRICRCSDEAPGIARFDDTPPGPAVASLHGGGKLEFVVVEDRTNEVTVHLLESRELAGRVVDARTDQPIQGAWIWVSHSLGNVEGEWHLRSDAAGRFVVPEATRLQRLSAWAPGFAPARCQPVWPDPSLATPESGIELRLTPSEHHALLAGRVLDADGAPLEGALVLFGPSNFEFVQGTDSSQPPPRPFQRTDSDGRFAIPVRRYDDPWSLWIRARDHALWHDRIDPADHSPDDPLLVRLERGARISGQVVDAGGAPVSAADVTLRDPRIEASVGIAWDGPDWARDTTATDAQGRYELAHVRAGAVVARATDGERLAATTLTLTDGSATEWNPVLDAGLTLAGVLVDEQDRPLPGWTVSPSAGSGVRWPGAVSTDPAGRFRIEGADLASYRLTLAAPDSAMHQAALQIEDVRPDASEPLRIVVPTNRHPTATLRGRLLDVDGTPLTEARVEPLLACPDGVRESAAARLSLDDGWFTLGLLRPGSYHIQVRAGDLTFDLGEHTLAPDQTLDLGTHRAAATGRLLVTVVDARGEPMPGVDLTIQGPGEPRSRLLSKPTAEQSLLPGTWKLSTWGRNVVDVTRTVEVVAGQLREFRFVVPDGVRVKLRMPAVPRQFYELRQVWRNVDSDETVIDATSIWNNAGREVEFEKLVPAGRYEVTLADASDRTGRPTRIDTARATADRFDLHMPQ